MGEKGLMLIAWERGIRGFIGGDYSFLGDCKQRLKLEIAVGMANAVVLKRFRNGDRPRGERDKVKGTDP